MSDKVEFFTSDILNIFYLNDIILKKKNCVKNNNEEYTFNV